MNKFVLTLLETILLILDLFGVIFWWYYSTTKNTRLYQDAGTATGGFAMLIGLLILTVIILCVGVGIGAYRSSKLKTNKSISLFEKISILTAFAVALLSIISAKLSY